MTKFYFSEKVIKGVGNQGKRSPWKLYFPRAFLEYVATLRTPMSLTFSAYWDFPPFLSPPILKMALPIFAPSEYGKPKCGVGDAQNCGTFLLHAPSKDKEEEWALWGPISNSKNISRTWKKNTIIISTAHDFPDKKDHQSRTKIFFLSFSFSLCMAEVEGRQGRGILRFLFFIPRKMGNGIRSLFYCTAGEKKVMYQGEWET